jgi:beta-N-acetylhexosaminidase
MKKKYNLFEKPYPDMDRVEKVVGCAEHRSFAEAVSRRSITVLKDENCLLPVKPVRIAAISTEPVILTGADDTIIRKSTFCEAVRETFGGEAHIIPLDPDDAAITRTADCCRDAETIIIGTYNANLNRGQVKLVNEMGRAHRNVIVVSLRSPYDITEFQGISTYLCAYEYTPVSIKSVIDILSGQEKAQGRLPVSIR